MDVQKSSNHGSCDDGNADKGPLHFIICGMEHTGTTLISDLFRQVPGIDAGFEVGVLLCQTPRSFPALMPFARNVLSGWGVAEADLAACCDTDDFSKFYLRLKQSSSVLKEGTEFIFDKTPRYIVELSKILSNVTVPVVVSCKDPRAIIFSDFKRANTDDFDHWYEDYAPKKLQYMASCYESWRANKSDPRICTVPLEALAMNARQTMEKMFEHVSEKFELRYALMDGLRYRNTRANFVSADIAFEFRRNLSREQQYKITKYFSAFDAWFYE